MHRTEVGPHVVQQADSRLESSYRAVVAPGEAALLHADPPYCLLVRRNKKTQRRRDPKRGAKLARTDVRRFENIDDYGVFTERWLRPALGCVGRCGHAIIWTNLLGRAPIEQVAGASGFHLHGTYLWAKLGKKGNVGEQVARLYEVALIFGRQPVAPLSLDAPCPPRHHISGYDDDGETSHWEHHPNHKAFSVLEPLIRAYSAPGDIVVEPFSGSGSTVAACVRLGRVGRALELRQQWAQVSGERLVWQVSQTASG